MRLSTHPQMFRTPARLVPVLFLAAASLAAPACAQEPPPTLQPAGRRPPAGQPQPPAATTPRTEPELTPAAEAAVPVAAAPAPAAPAAPAPAALTSPLSAEQVRARMPKLFAELASAEPAVRESARVGLMGLARPDLPAFEKLVRENVPLVPAQAAVLREVVTQAYLAGVEYPVGSRQGFLGVRLGEVSVLSRPDEDEAAEQRLAELRAEAARRQVNPFDRRPFAFAGEQTTGVLIGERMPGFCGARMLQDGDVVLGVVEMPNHPVLNPEDMKNVVTSFEAGQTIHFQLLRQGQVVRVPVTLDPRPEAAMPGADGMQQLLDNRRAEAEAYWERTFAPLLKEGVG